MEQQVELGPVLSAVRTVCPTAELRLHSDGRIEVIGGDGIDEKTAAMAQDIADQWANGALKRFITIQSIKAAAAADIYAKLPDWKQRNILARMIELAYKRLNGETLTVDEEAEVAAARQAWDFVKQRKKQSNDEEAALE